MLSRYAVYRLKVVAHSLLARIVRKRCYGYSIMKPYLQEKFGLEFGGPSSIFCANHLVPIYNMVRAIDNCNFANQTIWTTTNDYRRFGSRVGTQSVVEACDASTIADESYDFVVASHVLEHVANPLRALQEWKRILKPTGTLLVVLPHKAGMFDHKRPFTNFKHIKDDFELRVTEGDLTHLQEIIELHDLELDPPAGSPGQFQERCLQNFTNRAIHHHVFSPELVIEAFTFLDMRVINVAVEQPYHIIVHARKPNRDEPSDIRSINSAFLDEGAPWRKRDPFRITLKKAMD